MTDVQYALNQLRPLLEWESVAGAVRDRVQRAIDALERVVGEELADTQQFSEAELDLKS